MSSSASSSSIMRSLLIALVAMLVFCGLFALAWVLLITEEPTDPLLDPNPATEGEAASRQEPNGSATSGAPDPIDREEFSKDTVDQAYATEHHAQLIDAQGKPRPKISLWVTRENGVRHRIMTNDDGIISATRPVRASSKAALWKLCIANAGFDPESLPQAGPEITVAPSPISTTAKTFRLSPESILCSGRVSGADGLPAAAELTVTALQAGKPTRRLSWTSNDKGAFRIPGVNRNAWSYYIRARSQLAGVPCSSPNINFRPGDTEVDLVLSRHRRVNGTHRWASHQGLGLLRMVLVSTDTASGVGAVVSAPLTFESTPWRHGHQFSFPFVPPGSYDFHVRLLPHFGEGFSTIFSISGLQIPAGSGAFAPPELQEINLGDNLRSQEIKVVTSGGKPALGAIATVLGTEMLPGSSHGKRWVVRTDAHGKIIVLKPNATDLELLVQHAGHQEERISVPPWPKTIQLHDQGAVSIRFSAPLPHLEPPHSAWDLALVSGGGFSARPTAKSPRCRLDFGANQAKFEKLKPVLYRAFLVPLQAEVSSLESERPRARFVGVINLKRKNETGALTLEILPENLKDW